MEGAPLFASMDYFAGVEQRWIQQVQGQVRFDDARRAQFRHCVQAAGHHAEGGALVLDVPHVREPAVQNRLG